ncbi:RNA polymerase-associated protein RapA [bacterium]|nr:RNA polymerase-associated protein RapA [bacterium]
MTSYRPGQRYVSESEPELGLGMISSASEGRVTVNFAASEQVRTYSVENAPLRRVQFRAGDRILASDGIELTVDSLTQCDGLITYVCGERSVIETDLSSQISLHGPEDRLSAGRFDDLEDFELRWRSLDLQHRARRSPVRGFVGGRIDLIPHQLYIAHEVSSRHAPRVLLSDEVGLGKTIEACLIVHRLIKTGRAARVLVLVPESLVHQWFVEMLRRFNTWLHIFDEERCASIEAGDPEANPFLDDQLILASINFLAASPRRGAQVVDAGWDVLVVDEAHHLGWSPTEVSPDYGLVEQLSRRASGVLLLTATPEQLGVESHFARLRLLDPDRYSDLAAFEGESADYELTAKLAERIADGKKLDRKATADLKKLLAHDGELESTLAAVAGGDATARSELLNNLLDLHGPGRVVFRNSRAAMKGFPRRRVQLIPLEASGEADSAIDRVSTEFAVDAGDSQLSADLDLAKDPRIVWLAATLKDLEPQKVLLICRSLEKAEAIDDALRQHINLKAGVFHEGLTLLQRDRNAAWFAEEDGARLLICSEIGSEGRNFQFAHHLILFDLPLHPELLEQRIGRLDRIGQKEDIQIHVPFLKGSPQEVLARWYHEGLDAFETNLEGGNDLFKQFSRQVHDLALEFPIAEHATAEAELTELLEQSASTRRELRQKLEEGRDRLLELNSFRPAIAQECIDAIRAEDADPSLAEFLLDVFEHFGLHVEELAPTTWQLNPQGLTTDAFPSLPAEGMIATCDRRRALGREDVGFLTWDHPMVAGATDLLLSSEKGNCSFGILPHTVERTLLIEAVFVLEAIAADRLHVDRFLPATPVRVVVNHKPAAVTKQYPPETFAGNLKKGQPYKLLEKEDIARRVIPAMLKTAEAAADTTAKALIQESLNTMNPMLGHEIHRLQTLRKVNDHIRPEEIKIAENEQNELTNAIQNARLRLDCLRMIWKGPRELLD